MKTQIIDSHLSGNSFFVKTKEAIVDDVINQWNLIVQNGEVNCRKCDYELYKSIIYNFEVRKVYLDSSLNLVKLSHIVGTNTTYLSNAVNKYFKCNLKNLINKYRVEYAKFLLDSERISISKLPQKCGFSSRSVFFVAFKKNIGISPLQYVLSGIDYVKK